MAEKNLILTKKQIQQRIKRIAFEILEQNFKEKEIVFLYLSTDANFEAWKKANQFEKLTENSYLIINPKTSEYLKKLAIDFIPRYVLINSNGEISNPKSPSPDSEKIKQELNGLLKSK